MPSCSKRCWHWTTSWIPNLVQLNCKIWSLKQNKNTQSIDMWHVMTRPYMSTFFIPRTQARKWAAVAVLATLLRGGSQQIGPVSAQQVECGSWKLLGRIQVQMHKELESDINFLRQQDIKTSRHVSIRNAWLSCPMLSHIVPLWHVTKDGCISCSPGSFAALGMTECDLCAPGTISDQSGASACSPCGVGHFSQTTGSSICFGCPEGLVVFNSFSHSSISYMFF